MGYQSINEKGAMTVYAQSDCAEDSKSGVLYNGECFTYIGDTGYVGNYKIKFRNKNGQYVTGFFHDYMPGNLIYSGKRVTLFDETCYQFKLRQALALVDNKNNYVETLAAGDSIFSKSGTAGQTNPANMKICAYQKSVVVVQYDGFIRLDFTKGSMLASSFCLQVP